uniref:HECT domain-containing protein n=1 Tax=Macrostomum lignano TaxID=282301 RepID=A0A1I8FEK5_9PLAT
FAQLGGAGGRGVTGGNNSGERSWLLQSVLSEDGQVYSWGRNHRRAKIGREKRPANTDSSSGVVSATCPAALSGASVEAQAWPVLCKTLRAGQQIRHVACGKEHSAALTAGGGVFTFGSDESGQLGHGGSSGRKFADRSSAQTSSRSDGLGGHPAGLRTPPHPWPTWPPPAESTPFGLASRGQLGIGEDKDGCSLADPRRAPSAVKGPWVPRHRASSSSVAGSALKALTKSTTPLVLFACGHSSFLKRRSNAPLRPDRARSRRRFPLPSTILACSAARAASAGQILEVSRSIIALFYGRPLESAPSRADHGVRHGRSGETVGTLLAGIITLLNEQCSRKNYPDVECPQILSRCPAAATPIRQAPPNYSKICTRGFAFCLTQLDPVPTRRVLTGWLAKLLRVTLLALLRTPSKAVAPPRSGGRLPAHTTQGAGALAKERGHEPACMRLMRLLHSAECDRAATALVRSSFYLPDLNNRVDIE